jgi:hypothetical protein
MRTGSSGSGFLVTTRTRVGVTAWTDSMVVNPAVTTVFPGTRLRSSVARTSSAVSGAPSWNLMPGLRVNSQVVSFTAFQAVARPGWSCSAVSHRRSES